MNTKSLTGIVVGLMIATSMLYFYLSIGDFQEGETDVKTGFFLVVAIAHLPICAWMLKDESKKPHVIALIGTIFMVALYAVTRTDLALALGFEAGGFGGMGILSKSFQVGIVVGTIMMLFQLKSNKWIKQQA